MNVLIDAINMVDNDLIEEACVIKPNKKPGINKYLAAAAVFAVITVAVFAGVKYYNDGIRHVDSAGLTPVSSGVAFGGTAGDKEIGDGELVTEGTGFTDEEIKAFVEEKKYDLVGAVACEYGNFDDIYRISTVGYCHVSLGETNVLKRDYVTLPISLGDEIIAKVTLFKSDGEVRYDISVRGRSFDTLNKIFEENPESEIAFFYVDSFAELAITPSNVIYNIYDKQTDSLEENVDYYGKYKTEYNTFSLEKLNGENNYISVKPLYEENLGNSENNSEDLTQEEQITNNLTAATKAPEIDISIDDLLSKEIVSVEWGNSYDLLMEKPFKECTDEQADKIVSIISGMTPVVADEVIYFAGGGWIARLNYADGTYAYVCARGENQLVFENSEGYSPVYDDLSGNASLLADYLISLV